MKYILKKVEETIEGIEKEIKKEITKQEKYFNSKKINNLKEIHRALVLAAKECSNPK